jgi:hypothetical protein
MRRVRSSRRRSVLGTIIERDPHEQCRKEFGLTFGQHCSARRFPELGAEVDQDAQFAVRRALVDRRLTQF